MSIKSLLLPGDLHISKEQNRKNPAYRGLFLDLDGILWPDSGPGSILKYGRVSNHLNDVLLQFLESGFYIIGITNQTFPGYHKRFKFLNAIKYRYKLSQLLKKSVFDHIFICHHHPKSKIGYLKLNCNSRKPFPGSIEKALELLRIDREKSIIIGDRITDIAAGHNAGIGKKLLVFQDYSLAWNEGSPENRNDVLSFGIFRNLEEALIALLDLEFER